MPRLRIAANAAETTSSVTTPIVTIAWSAPTPQVSSSARACASSVVATACVAPKVSADSRLNATGSTAMTYRAPGDRRALQRVDADAADAVDDRGVARLDLARLDRRPEPGRHPAAGQRRQLERDVVLDLHHRRLRQHRALGERPEQAHLPEVGRALVVAERPVGQRVVVPGTGRSRRGWSGRARRTGTCRRPAGTTPPRGRRPPAGSRPSPTCSTTPAPSCPPTIGYRTGMSPVRRWSSEWQSPEAANRISTSPVFGSSRSSSTISNGLPTSLSTAARVFMQHPPGE